MRASSEYSLCCPPPDSASCLPVPINRTMTVTFWVEVTPSPCICLQTVCLDPAGSREHAYIVQFVPLGCRILSPQLPGNVFLRREARGWVVLHTVIWKVMLSGLNKVWLQYVWPWAICKCHIFLFQFWESALKWGRSESKTAAGTSAPASNTWKARLPDPIRSKIYMYCLVPQSPQAELCLTMCATGFYLPQ